MNQTQQKKIQLNKAWNAEEGFINNNKMNEDTEEPMAQIAGALISRKRNLKKIGVLQKHLKVSE